MRRALVLGDESARHPFRKTVPPHVRNQIGRADDIARHLQASGLQAERTIRKIVSQRYVRDFAFAFCACFVATSIFIA